MELVRAGVADISRRGMQHIANNPLHQRLLQALTPALTALAACCVQLQQEQGQLQAELVHVQAEVDGFRKKYDCAEQQLLPVSCTLQTANCTPLGSAPVWCMPWCWIQRCLMCPAAGCVIAALHDLPS